MTTKKEPTKRASRNSAGAAKGRVAVSCEGRILICAATGPFGPGLVEELRAGQAPYLRRLAAGGKWGVIIYILGTSLSVSDIAPELTLYLRERAGSGIVPTASALVLETPPADVDDLTMIYQVIYGAAGTALHIVPTLPEAIAWIKSRIA